MLAKKLLFIASLIILISSICSTASATANNTPTGRRYGAQAIMSVGDAPSTRGLFLGNPYWDMYLDAAGYSDFIGWKYSPRPHATGEMLSGEWGAAIYYDGISTEPEAMWLTDRFVFPDWYTNSDFEIFEDPNSWDDPCNPVDGTDTGYSIIRNGQIEVRIDYEVVDLGEQDPNTGEGGSQLAFRDANGTPVFAYSERYVLLQTYTITNIGPNTINNLEFYQLLVGVIANHSFYETTPYTDPLEDYAPYNKVHATGKFHYDITQWDGYINCIGFSSTVEPNAEPNSFDNGYYGWTDRRIEQRRLNGEPNSKHPSIGVAGAMGWYLGMLGPNESVSHTLTIALGSRSGLPMPIVEFSKNDNINDCVEFGDEIMYTISYRNSITDPCDPRYGTVNDVNIIDYLPNKVDFQSASGNWTGYDSNTVIIWNIGTLEPNESGSVTLTVKVKCPEPGGTITNCCKIKSGELVLSNACEDTRVCCGHVPVIYVDVDATGCNNGISWQDAYNYLRDALETAQRCGCDEIRVAEGIYKPDEGAGVEPNDREAAFQLISNVTVKGGFAGYGAENPDAREIKLYETILSGDIGIADENTDNSYHVVTGSYTEPNAVLDGFTITGGNGDSRGGGMFNESGSPTVINCVFSKNLASGGYMGGGGGGMCNSSSNPNVINCTFSENLAGAGGGMSNYSSNPTITNCIFKGNYGADRGGALYGSATLINCVVVGNTATNGGGIYGDATVSNCILWDNSPEQIKGPGGSFTYCDIQDDRADGWPGIGNVSADPCFVDPDGGDYRLLLDSPCIDAGDNTAVPRDTLDIDVDGNTRERFPIDLDGLPRFIDSLCTGDTGNCIPPFVDMGAYEFRIVELTKVDINDPNCAGPNDDITYIIDSNYPAGQNCGDIYNVNIIDYLPNEVNYISSDPCGTYNSDSHTVTWNIGTLKPGDTNSVALTVKVKDWVKQCSKIRNCCMIRSGKVVLNVSGTCEVPPLARNCAHIHECGWNYPGDLNRDCRVNFLDFAILANDWWRCMAVYYPMYPFLVDESCEHPWWP